MYTLATTVILTPFVRIAAPLQQVFLPAFSELREEPERMADFWIRATRMVAAISIPSLIGIAIVDERLRRGRTLDRSGAKPCR